MKSTMEANGQTDSSMEDDRSSMGSYKRKSLKYRKSTSYCSACEEPHHNASKCKVKYTLFFDFCSRRGHAAKACRYRMNGHSICIHCRINHGNEPCQRSQLNNREDMRENLTFNLHRVTQTLQLTSTTKAIWL